MEFEKKRIINYLDMKKEMEILEDIKGLWESEERKIIQEAEKYEVENRILEYERNGTHSSERKNHTLYGNK